MGILNEHSIQPVTIFQIDNVSYGSLEWNHRHIPIYIQSYLEVSTHQVFV